MPEATHEPIAPGQLRATRLQTLPQRTYRFRTLGMGLAALPVGAVLAELGAPWPAWAWMVFSCLLWPHLAYWLARRAPDPFLAELRNFVGDSMFAGSWAPLMHFNLLPSVVLVTVVTADKVNAGVRGLWLRSLPWMAGGMLMAGLLSGFAFAPMSSMRVILACLPIMVIHTLAVSLGSYKLVRRVQRQNLQLEELSRIDALTGLDGRRHWEAQAEAMLQAHRERGTPATLMLVDVDRFKLINDRHGHAVGDDVLRAIAERLRAALPPESHAGRLGGDEFVVALPCDLASAAGAAEAVRAVVESLEFPRSPGLRCSVSLGLASAPGGVLGLREWLEAADRSLYAAKSAGRNRTAGAGESGNSRSTTDSERGY
jgi:diguanylate cyclase